MDKYGHERSSNLATMAVKVLEINPVHSDVVITGKRTLAAQGRLLQYHNNVNGGAVTDVLQMCQPTIHTIVVAGNIL